MKVIVIGSGSAGLGVALAAARRGWTVEVLEARDIGGGTSTTSTKLIHGGVRYLEAAFKRLSYADWRLVREALAERAWMLRSHPTLCQAIPIVLPVSSWLEKGYYGIGLWLYDRLSYPHHLQATRWLSEKGLYKCIPGLRSGYSGGWVYWDGQFVDRLYAVHLALFLRQRFGVVIHTHARVVSIQPHERYVAVQATFSDGSIYETAGDYVVNATGPWADEIRAMVRPNATPRLRLSRGSHWVLPRRALPLEAGFLVPRTEDGRLLFVLPWLEDTVLVGTTDVEVSKPAWPARVSDEEEAFLDAHLRKYFDLRGERKVLARFAGYRPLVAQKVGSTARLARSHVVEVWPEARFVSLMGGKWTTFRKMGEDALGQLTKACRVSLPAGEVVDSIVPDWTLLEKCRSAYPEPIVSGLPYTWGEVVFWQELGWAQEPEDLVAGRWLLPYIDEEKAAIVRKALTVKWRTASVS